MVAYIGSVVAGGAGPLDGLDSQGIVQTPNIADADRKSIEENFSASYGLATFSTVIALVMSGVICPGSVQRKCAGVELRAGGITTEGVVDADVEILLGEISRATQGAVLIQVAGTTIKGLCRE